MNMYTPLEYTFVLLLLSSTYFIPIGPSSDTKTKYSSHTLKGSCNNIKHPPHGVSYYVIVYDISFPARR